jgi:hypothetical protein
LRQCRIPLLLGGELALRLQLGLKLTGADLRARLKLLRTKALSRLAEPKLPEPERSLRLRGGRLRVRLLGSGDLLCSNLRRLPNRISLRLRPKKLRVSHRCRLPTASRTCRGGLLLCHYRCGLALRHKLSGRWLLAPGCGLEQSGRGLLRAYATIRVLICRLLRAHPEASDLLPLATNLGCSCSSSAHLIKPASGLLGGQIRSLLAFSEVRILCLFRAAEILSVRRGTLHASRGTAEDPPAGSHGRC